MSYHGRSAIEAYTIVEHRINAVVNQLNKTKVEKHNDPNELVRLRQDRDAAEAAEQRVERETAKVERKQAEKDARKKEAEEAALALEQLNAFDSTIEAAAKKQEMPSEMTLNFASPSSTKDAVTPSAKPKKKGGIVDKRSEVNLDAAVDVIFGGGQAAKGVGESGQADEFVNTGGGWLDDDSDDDFWGGGSSSKAVDVSDFGGGKEVKHKDKSLGALGQEVEKVEAGRFETREMEKLTDVAHQRKAAAQKKAAELEAKKAAEAEAAAIALAAKRARKSMASGQRWRTRRSKVQQLRESKLEADRASGTLDEALEANQSVAEEELMVLEAIFGEEAFERDMDESLPTFTLLVTECNGKGEEATSKAANHDGCRVPVAFAAGSGGGGRY